MKNLIEINKKYLHKFNFPIDFKRLYFKFVQIYF
jgi:hypothetical protein